MASQIFPVVNRSKLTKPLWPYSLNLKSPQTRGLITWWPISLSTGNVQPELVANNKLILGRLTTIKNARQGGPCLVFTNTSGESCAAKDSQWSIYNFGTTEYSACAWIYNFSTTTFENIIQYSDETATSSNRWILRLSNSPTLQYTAFDGGTTTTTGNKILANRQWYHVAITRNNGGFITLYINGDVDVTAAATARNIGNINNSLFVGGAPSETSRFNGQIEDIRLYNKELTQSEVFNIFSNPYNLYTSTRRATIFLPNMISESVPTDSITLTDSVIDNISYARTISNAVALTDSLTYFRDITLTDTISFSDTGVFETDLDKQVLDVITFTDQVDETNIHVTQSVTDTISFTQQIDDIPIRISSFTETVILTDSVTYFRDITLADTISLSDSEIDFSSKGVNDLLTFTQTATFTRELGVREIVDRISLTHNGYLGRQLALSIETDITFIDKFIDPLHLQLVDTINITQKLNNISQIDLSDEIFFTNNVDTIGKYDISVIDSITLTDNGTVPHYFSLSHTITFVQLFSFYTFIDTISLSDSVSLVTSFPLSDNINIVDSVVRHNVLNLSVVDNISLQQSTIYYYSALNPSNRQYHVLSCG